MVMPTNATFSPIHKNVFLVGIIVVEVYSPRDTSIKLTSINFIRLNQGPFHLNEHVRSLEN
jgi:hypothetical protein